MLSIRGIFTNATGTLLSRVLGLFKNIFVNFYFGLVDTFWGAFQIVNTFRIFVGEGAINNVFIPIYKKLREEKPDHLKYFSIKSFSFVFLLSVILSALLILTSYPLAKLVLPGFSENKIVETAVSMIIMSLVVVLISLQSFLAALQISKYNSFISFAYAPVVANIITIMVIIIFHNIGIYILSWSVVIGSLGMFLFQILFFLKDIKKFKHDIEVREIFKLDPYTKSFVLGFFSVIILSLITQLNGIVSRFFASFFEGVVAATTNAYILVQVPIGMFSVAVSVVGLNTLSEYFSRNDIDNFRKTSGESLKLLNLLIVPITVVMVVFSYDIVKLIYRDISGIILGSEGKYSAFALKLTQELFSMYAIATYFLSLNLVITRISFSRGNTKIPLVSSIISLLANIVANTAIFLIFRSYIGIPLSFAISSFLSSLYILVVEQKNIGGKGSILYEFFVLVLVCVIVSFGVKIVFSFVPLRDTYLISFTITLVKLIIAGGIILMVGYFFGLSTLKDILKKL